MQNAKCKMQNAKCKMQNARLGCNCAPAWFFAYRDAMRMQNAKGKRQNWAATAPRFGFLHFAFCILH
jgi:hypothetical protein